MAQPGRLPGQQARLGAQGAQGLGDQPEHPRPRRRLPDRRGRHARSRRSCTTPSAARRSSSPAPGRGRCRPTSGSARSTASPTTGRSTTSSSSPTSTGPTATSASPGCPATRPTRRTPRTRRCRRCRSGRRGSRWRAGRRSSAGTGGPSSTRSTRRNYDGRRPCVQRSTCQSGCNEGAKASTDLTHWPKAIALGARLVTGARVRRIETNERGPRDRRDLDRPRRRRALRAGAGSWSLAANAIGTPRLLLLSARRPAPRRPRELVGPRRQAADDASVRERRRAVRGAADELAGPVRRPHRVARVLRDRREARLRPRRPLGPRADRRPDQHGAPEPGRRAGLGPGPPRARPERTSATAPTGACSPRTCPTRRTTSRCRRR